MAVAELILIRHGESMGNAAAAAANAAQAEVIAIDQRDADVPLSPVGLQQAEALGTGLQAALSGERASMIWSSPYVRAFQTAEAWRAEPTTSWRSPSEARCALTRSTVCAAKSARSVPQSEPGEQSPAAVVARAVGRRSRRGGRSCTDLPSGEGQHRCPDE